MRNTTGAEQLRAMQEGPTMNCGATCRAVEGGARRAMCTGTTGVGGVAGGRRWLVLWLRSLRPIRPLIGEALLLMRSLRLAVSAATAGEALPAENHVILLDHWRCADDRQLMGL